ncbi:MAG TPA: hypothetical protein VHZ24_11250 [Pirellulales bacterium]|jgi:hypothetical protein|nr:hypothetical protein [Pirellulales bacterium]
MSELDQATLLLMFGHGVPGMTCSLDVNLFDDVRMHDKIVLCGSCYSATPLFSDFDKPSQGDDGSPIRNDRPRFAFRAIANGATVVYGHMRINGGFPEMFPVLEAWMQGLTVGEAYQRQMNALLDWPWSFPRDRLVVPADGRRQPNALRGRSEYLYVIIGDPALVPL